MYSVPTGVIGAFGQEINCSFTYNSTSITNDSINKFRIYYNGDLFKTMMKCFEVEVSEDFGFSKGDELEDVTMSCTVDSSTASINYGTFIIYDISVNKEDGSVKLICYDYMLKAMETYETIISSSMTVINYIAAIATAMGCTFDTTATVVNGSMTVDDEYFDGGQYTYRDALDMLAEATASTIRVKDKALLVSYPDISNPIAVTDDGFSSADVKEKYGPINSVVIGRDPLDDNVYLQDTESVEENGLTEIKFNNNFIMDESREDWLPAILAQVDGYEFYSIELKSFGIGYLEPCDVFNITLADNYYGDTTTYSTYKCILLNDDLNIEQGMEENIQWDIPSSSETDYSISTTTEKSLITAYARVDKVAGEITLQVGEISETVYDEETGLPATNALADGASSTADSALDKANANAGDISDLAGTITSVRTSLQTQIEQNANAITLSATKSELTTVQNALSSDIDSVESSVSALSNTVSSVEVSISSLQAAISAIQNGIGKAFVVDTTGTKVYAVENDEIIAGTYTLTDEAGNHFYVDSTQWGWATAQGFGTIKLSIGQTYNSSATAMWQIYTDSDNRLIFNWHS